MTSTHRGWTRRNWIQKLGAVASAPLLASAPARKLEVDRLLERFSGAKWNQEQKIYRVDAATGTVTVVVDDFVQPNGLAFSPDEKRLYVVDTG